MAAEDQGGRVGEMERERELCSKTRNHPGCGSRVPSGCEYVGGGVLVCAREHGGGSRESPGGGRLRHTGQPRSGVRSVRLCLHSATRPRKAHTCTDNRQHTRGTPTVGVQPLPSATSPRGDERDMDQAAIGRGSQKQQGSTKH
eukprot:scaffold8088_cov107-Isochrysis_galbana.AAC.1